MAAAKNTKRPHKTLTIKQKLSLLRTPYYALSMGSANQQSLLLRNKLMNFESTKER